MHRSTRFPTHFSLATFLIILLSAPYAFSHGGVAFEEDLCVLNIGFLKAHFTGYQPLDSASDEFCEDIPYVSESIFVIDYLHDFLKEMSVDFRIIRDTSDLGIYANWDDIEKIADIEKETVFYQAPAIRPDGVFTSTYTFKEKGGYIGIVTASHPSKDNDYQAVFYFQVGGANWGYLPLFVLFLAFAQGLYWFINKRFSRKNIEVENIDE